MPLLYFELNEILVGPGSFLWCEEPNSADLRIIKFVRNRLMDFNKEGMLLRQRSSKHWNTGDNAMEHFFNFRKRCVEFCIWAINSHWV